MTRWRDAPDQFPGPHDSDVSPENDGRLELE